MAVKTCRQCQKSKDITDFYKRPRYKNGIQSRCIECEKNATAKYQKSTQGRAMLRKHNERDYQKFRHKQLARVRLRAAILGGNIARPRNCSNCLLEVRVQGHHEDYSKPLDVIWLCDICHKDRHGRLIPTNSIFKKERKL